MAQGDQNLQNGDALEINLNIKTLETTMTNLLLTANRIQQSIDQMKHGELGATAFLHLTTASTNSTLIAAGPRTLHSIRIWNTAAATYYLKLYNKATAPNVGTDVPIMLLLLEGTAGGVTPTFGFDHPIAFTLGLGFGVTSGLPIADVGNAVTGIVLNFGYV